MWNRGAKARDFAQHRCFVGAQDRRPCFHRAERADHGHRRRQGDLEALPDRQRAFRLCRDKIEIRGPRLAGITEFAEMNLFRRNAFRQFHWMEAEAALSVRRRIGREIGVGTQHRELPADPQPPAAGLTVRHAFQIAADDHTAGIEYLLDGIEPYASNEVNGSRHRSLPLRRFRGGH